MFALIMAPFLLNSHNVHSYLVERGLCDNNSLPTEVKLKPAKNFNLLVSLNSGKKFLVKQEFHFKNGRSGNEFFREWRVRELINRFPEIESIYRLLPAILHFDLPNSILVLDYLDNHQDLDELYLKSQIFPTDIAGVIGSLIASIHRSTFRKSSCQDFVENSNGDVESKYLIPFYGIGDRVTPNAFGSLPSDGLKFLSFYQRYESLEKSILSLKSTYDSCCFIHQDFKLNNILICEDWKQSISKPQLEKSLFFIDWERSGWGDPAVDLGSIISSYLQIWVGSLIISSSISLEESLRMAVTPLELLQPSLSALMCSYLTDFPEIYCYHPNFVQRVVQFAGLAIIQQIRAMIQYQKVFNNTGICMLQVAKSFLCRPEQSILTIFGQSEKDLIDAVAFQSKLVSV